MGIRAEELTEKTVISVCDGKCLGNICDFEIDPCSGKIEAIFVPEGLPRFFLGREGEIRIPWDKIKQLGEDAVLVETEQPRGDCCCEKRPSGKRRWL